MKYTIIAIIKPLTTPLIKPIDLSSFSPKGTIFTALDIKCIINPNMNINNENNSIIMNEDNNFSADKLTKPKLKAYPQQITLTQLKKAIRKPAPGGRKKSDRKQ